LFRLIHKGNPIVDCSRLFLQRRTFEPIGVNTAGAWSNHENLWVAVTSAYDTKTAVLVLLLAAMFLVAAMVAAYFTRSGLAVGAVLGGFAIALTAAGLVRGTVRSRNLTVSIQGPAVEPERQSQRRLAWPWRRNANR
jgi:hypothetical protein